MEWAAWAKLAIGERTLKCGKSQEMLLSKGRNGKYAFKIQMKKIRSWLFSQL